MAQAIFEKNGNKYAALLFAFLLLSGCGMGGEAYAPPASSAAAVVDLDFSSFGPETVTIQVGQTVEWKNTSFISHTVTGDPKLAKEAKSAMLPAGAAAFDSGRIPSGGAYTHTFTVPGTYRYFCQYHEAHGMVGTVIVER